MDKYEYKQKTEQMLELMEEGAYSKAAMVADTIDWKRVRNTKMLIDVSEIYEKSGDYRKSYDVLNIAYHRSEGSRKVLYQLCTLALKTKNVDEAIDYYDEFVQIAPKDPNQYILRYQILRAQRAPVEQQIEVLEAFKKAEYIEEWAYELAKLYQEAGMTAECLDECDDLILWFSEGKYVYQAMELKMRYKPLTPSQQEKYDHRFDGLSNETVEMPDLVEYKNGAEEGAEKEELKETENPVFEKEEIPASVPETSDRKKKIGNTMKLDEALKSLLNSAPDAEGKEGNRDSSGDPVSMDVVFEEDRKSSFDTAIEEIESVADLNLTGTFSDQKGIKELKVDPDLEELRPEPLPGEVGSGDTIIFQKITQEDLQKQNESASVSGELDGDVKALMEELDAETKALMEGLDTEEADDLLEEVDEERDENRESEAQEDKADTEAEADTEIEEGKAREAVSESAAEREDTQIEGQMSLLDLMEDLESSSNESESAGTLEEEPQEGKGEPEQSEGLPEMQEEAQAEYTAEDEPEETQAHQTEENAGKEERMDHKKAESILPADIQRLIDEIEGVIPEEAEEDAVMEEEISEDELLENMGEVAESLRVDESSEVFEDYDDVLDEEEYAEDSQEEGESGETAEHVADYELRKEEGTEDSRDSEESYVEEEPYEEAGYEEDGYEETDGDVDEYEEEAYVESEYEEDDYGEAGEYSDDSEEYEEEAYVESEYEEDDYKEAGEYSDGSDEYEEEAYEESEYEEDGYEETDGNPDEYKEEVYEEAEYEEPDGNADEYEEEAYVESEYEEADYEEAGEYSDGSEEYEEEAYEESEYEEADYEEAGEYSDDSEEYEEEAYEEAEYEEDGYEETDGDADEYEEEAYVESEYEEAGEYSDNPDEYEEEVYEEAGYEEDDYEETDEYPDEYEAEDYEEDEYEDGEYSDTYEESEYEDGDVYEEGSELIEESLREEFSPNWDAEDLHDEREIEEEEEEEIDLLSATTPLSRKETAKMIATGKTSPLPLDEISDALSMSDTGFIVHGKYDLETQSGIGTRAGLTEEQKKLFSYFVPVRGMSEQLVDVLEQDKNCTNRQGTSSIGNLLIIGNKGNGKTVLAVDVVKAIQKQRGIQKGKVAIVTGDSLNRKKISDIFNKLYGGALIIEKAGKMNEKTVARVNKAMERDTGELLIVLEDQRKPLDRLLSSDREFRRKFTSRLEVPILINDELVTFGQAYAQENGYQIDEMGILALYSRIDTLQREDHAVTIAEVKEVMDEAMEHSQKASAKKLMRRVFGRNTDDSDRIILTEKDFN